MTNDLKNFLEKNSEIETFDGAINVSEHNTKVVNFVLDLVEKEVHKKPTAYFLEGEAFIRSNDIDESINNLRV